MNKHDRAKLLEIRLASKRGQKLTNAEMQFCASMYAQFPKEYAAMNDEITTIIKKEMSF